jgi:transcriptional regulator with XRE-family HTH domain
VTRVRRSRTHAPTDPAEFNAAFGAHLRKLRIAAGLRQADLTGPGLGASAIARIEGGYSGVSLAALALLATRLKCSPRTLIPPGW